ncbi:MAG: PKD domain-containing protein [Myxococcota bacterium]
MRFRLLFPLWLLAGSASAVEYSFVQDRWTVHPATPDNTRAVHPTDLTGWNRYERADSTVSAAMTVGLVPTSGAMTLTSDADFLAGSFTNVSVRGQGPTADLALLVAGDYGDGSDGVLVVDGRPSGGGYFNQSTDRRPHTCTRDPYLLDQQPDFSVKQFTEVRIINGGCLSMSSAQPLPSPGLPTTTGTSSGSLLAGTYYYAITALDDSGAETTLGPQRTTSVAVSGSAVDVRWAPVAYAGGYKVYRSTAPAGPYQLACSPSAVSCAATSCSCRDGSAAAPFGQPPPFNGATKLGRLSFRASRSVFIDATSSIDAAAKVPPHMGAGRGFPSLSCAVSGPTCPTVLPCTTFATGGAHAGSHVASECYECNDLARGYRCGTPGNAAYGSSALNPPTVGSGGGNAVDGTAGAGGGGVRIHANRIDVLGAVVATGSSSTGHASAGSGGSILLLGGTLNLAGQLTARGGAGQSGIQYTNGSDGRIRLDYGALVETGTVSAGPGGSVLRAPVTTYVPSGTFQSSTQDLGAGSTQLTQLTWTANTPVGTQVQLQLDSSDNASTWTGPLGPDCTAGSFYATSGQALCASSRGKRYYRVIARLSTSNVSATPVLSDISLGTSTLPVVAELVSSWYDTADAFAVLTSVGFLADLPTGTSVGLQLRTAPDLSGSPNLGSQTAWLGPTSSTDEYVNPSGTTPIHTLHKDIGSGGQSDRWVQYRAVLKTSRTSAPTLRQVRFAYAPRYRIDALANGQGDGLWGAPGSGAGGTTSGTVYAGVFSTIPWAIQNEGAGADFVNLSPASVPSGWTVGFTDGIASYGLPASLGPVAPGQTLNGHLVVRPAGTSGTSSLVFDTLSGGAPVRADSVRFDLTTSLSPPPSAPVLLSPADQAVDLPVLATLTWQPSPGAASYLVKVDTNSSLSAPPVTVSAPSTRHSPTVTEGATYFWAVAASGPNGTSAYSPTRRFTVGSRPSAVALQSPPNSVTRVGPPVTLSWLPATGSPPLSYVVQVSQGDSSFATGNLLLSQAGISGTSVSVTGVLASTRYYWRVWAENGFGQGASGPVFELQTGAPPQTVVLGFPGDEASGIDLDEDLVWEEDLTAALPIAYTVTVNQTDYPVQDRTKVSLLEVLGGPAQPDTTYTWKVKAANAFGVAESLPATFTTGTSSGTSSLRAVLNVRANTVQIGGYDFDGSFSRPQQGHPIVEYRFDFGDGTAPQIGAQNTATHGYLAPGGYLARLTVKDDQGLTATDSAPVQIASPSGQVPPVVEASASPASGELQNGELAVQLTSTVKRGSAEVTSFRWDFNDGTTSREESPSHLYKAPGVYQAKVTVVDANGLWAWDQVSVTVTDSAKPRPLTVRAYVDKPAGAAPHSAQLTCEAADPEGTELSFAWDFGDGATGDSAIVGHAFSSVGIYPVSCRVSAADGRLGEASVEVRALAADGKLPPRLLVATDSPARFICPGQPFDYVPFALGDAPVSYQLVQQPQGMTMDASTAAVSWTPTQGQMGEHPVSVVATNGAGSDSLDFTITVQPCRTTEPIGCCQSGPGPTELFTLALALLALRATRRGASTCTSRRPTATPRRPPPRKC